ncbi:MAG: hypothetical protein WCA11_11405 [Terracidiphilus sp.]
MEIINGTKTQTMVFSGTPKTSARHKTSGRTGSTSAKAPSTSTVEVTNGEKTQTQVFAANQRKVNGQKAVKKHLSAGTGTPMTIEVINGTSEQTKTFSGAQKQPVKNTAPKSPDSKTEPN